MTNEEYFAIENNFLNDLKQVFTNHSVLLLENDQYNETECCVSDVTLHFKVGKKNKRVQTIDTCEQILRKMLQIANPNDFY